MISLACFYVAAIFGTFGVLAGIGTLLDRRDDQ